MKIVWVRRISQLFFLLLFLWFCVVSTLGTQWWQLRGWPVNWFLQLDPLAALGNLLTTGTIYAGMLWAVATIVLTIVFGRFFCGWLCPLGTAIDAAGKIVTSPSNRLSQKWDKLRWLKFGILLGCVLLALFSVNVWGYLDPLSIFNRALTVVFYPLGTLFVDETLLAAGRIP